MQRRSHRAGSERSHRGWLDNRRADGVGGADGVFAKDKGQTVRFGPCDPVANSDRKRARAPKEEIKPGLPFDPIAALLQKAREVDGE